MKKIFLLIIFIISLSNVFAQAIIIYQKSGTKYTLQTSQIDSIVFYSCADTAIVYRGKTYHTIQIGTQCWLRENLNVGVMIDSSIAQTNNGIIEKYCYYNDTNKCNIYGGLYQWAEAVQHKNGATNTNTANPPLSGKVQGICPDGWHIPNNSEWSTLLSTVSNNSNTLKAIGQGSGSGAGTNTSGFSALLAGWLNLTYDTFKGHFLELGVSTSFWSSSENLPGNAKNLYLVGSDSNPQLISEFKPNGSSIRCVKD